MAYDKSFYEEQSLGSRNSAKEIVPFLLQLFPVRSVVDLGCGLGTWLAEFRNCGVTDVVGYDGDYVPREYLQIPAEQFHAADLANLGPSDRRFDLAMSLEVAEHIAPAKAAEFVENLTSRSDIVMFSCALPYQGGTGHVNENYPEYWAILFREKGYVPVDVLRERFWHDGMICPWYRQNILLFIKRELYQSRYAGLPAAEGRPLTRVHPEMYLWSCVRPRETELDPLVFERDKVQFYPLVEAWLRGLPMPENTGSYGSEYNIEYSEMPWWKKLKLKLAYYRHKRKS